MSEIDPLLLQESSSTREEAATVDAHVSNLELFSDLTMVVAIHITSEPLEEGTDEHMYAQMGQYIFRVFLLWYLWHTNMVVTNVDNLFSKNRPSAETHLFLFTEMALIIGIAKCCRSGNTGIASVLYLIGRSLQIATYHWITHFQQPTMEHISDERLENIREIGKLMKPTFVVLELIPLVLAICLSGSKLDNPSGVNLIPAFTCIFITLLARTLGALIYDRKPDHDQNNVFGMHHILERYELITLIFFGELCFAAASEPGAFIPSLCCFLTAIGCYLHYFTAKDVNIVPPFGRSALRSMTAHHLHFGIFCVVPIIGVGFVRVIEMVSEDDEGEVETDSDHHSHIDNDVAANPSRMICFSVGIFVLCCGLINSSKIMLGETAIFMFMSLFKMNATLSTLFGPVVMSGCAAYEIHRLKVFKKQNAHE